MTKKDYILIAASLARTRQASQIGGGAKEKAAKLSAVRLATADLAATLAADNPRFNRARFLAAVMGE